MSESIPVNTPERLDFQPAPGLARLLLRNFFYGLLTLGFYRFWARTNLRRYLWGAVRLQDEPLDYTGTGRELFLGFIIVMAVFVPVSLIYGGIQVALAGDAPALASLDGLYFIVLLLLVAVAQFRARRYRLSRTLWRGIRAGQGGSSWAYLGRFALWLLAAIVTLGFSIPWAAADLARYRMRHTYWGSFQGDFVGAPNQLLLPIAWMWGALVGMLGWSVYDFFTLADGMQRQIAVYKIMTGGALMPVLFIYFQMAWLRWYIDGMRLGPLRFKADFSAAALFWRLALGGLLVLIAVGALWIGLGFAIGMAAVNGGLTQETAFGNPLVILAIVLMLPLLLLCLRLAYYYLMFMPALRRVVLGVSVIGLDAAMLAQQAAPDQMRSGEGLADSFDIPL
ncbi:DUF898 family protein [Ferrovibrio sp.]|uniref:DUF898 family protein n=1 Tax=Ferrovibrio sp. TaxID=1917215 RepID=UPI001B6FCE90|nr:DUF898 family protein [Ferrovibrio sp.]MBP7064436.1 DUF898 family protein [Ferrovibrio sp.]